MKCCTRGSASSGTSRRCRVTQEALRAGDRAWSKVLMDWGAWQREGLTQHENWWPALYADACRRLGWTHDPRVASFDTSYAEQRADLKSVSHSG